MVTPRTLTPDRIVDQSRETTPLKKVAPCVVAGQITERMDLAWANHAKCGGPRRHSQERAESVEHALREVLARTEFGSAGSDAGPDCATAVRKPTGPLTVTVL